MRPLLRVRVGAMGVLQQSRRSWSVDKAWTKRGQSVDKAWKSHLWKSHFWEWNIHLGEWTNRGHPAECHLSLKGVQVTVAELKSTELNCATFSKTKGGSKRASLEHGLA